MMRITDIRAVLLKISALVLLIVLTGCNQQFEGDGDRSATINENGRELYNEQCASCHGPSGEGGSGGALIACATCGSQDSLIKKIERDMPTASNPLKGSKASDVAEYVIAAFNESASGKVQRSLPGVSSMTPKESVYKLALELAGRLPTESEVSRFTGNLSGEKEVIYSYMETDYFYERLKDIFNDSLLTDAYRDENQPQSFGLRDIDSLYSNTFRLKINPNGRLDNGNSYSAFPSIEWQNDFTEAVNAEKGNSVSNTYLAYFTREAMARKPLLMVEYLARNNRDFREFVSGKYSVANRFSFEAFNNGENGPNAKVIDPDHLLGNGAAAIVENPVWKKWDNRAELDAYLDVISLYNNPVRTGDLSENYIMRDFPYDPRDIKPVQLYYNDESGTPQFQGVPHSGVITDEIFLQKYTATETNLHRHRARMVYWFFAAKDLLAIEGNRDASLLDFEDFGNSVGVTDPTNSNPDCMVCHTIMDPVAKAFEDYKLNGLYDVRNADLMEIHDDSIGWGLSTAQINTTGGITGNYNNRELQWLGEQIAADPAYSRGIAQIIVKGMTGQEILGEPSLESPEEYRQAYAEQARLISNVASEFVASNYNIKALIYAITKSAYYRAETITSHILEDDYGHIGSVRYLPPELLNQKLRALNSGGWGVSAGINNTQDLRRLNSRSFLGGKNSSDKPEDVDSVGGIIAAGLERMAVEESCDMVRRDFDLSREERLLFKYVDDSTDLTADSASARTAQISAIRSNIAYLYLAVLHKEVHSDSPEVDIAFQLFIDVLLADVDTRCSTGGNRTVREAWYAVMVFLLNDYRFVYS
ncbi:MAG: c-type cytochrome [Reinekea sp.]